MSRVGWVVLAIVLLAAGLFASMLSFGGGVARPALPRVADDRDGTTAVDAAGQPLLIVPVRGVARSALVDSWGQARAEGRAHHGTDIPAPAGTPVLAAAAGTVEKLFQSERGGTTLYQRSPDRRWIYYYAHLQGYAPGIVEGKRVRAGDPVGFVGDTGDAGAGNYHLHFGLTRTDPAQHWYQGQDVNAFPSLAGTAARR